MLYLIITEPEYRHNAETIAKSNMFTITAKSENENFPK